MGRSDRLGSNDAARRLMAATWLVTLAGCGGASDAPSLVVGHVSSAWSDGPLERAVVQETGSLNQVVTDTSGRFEIAMQEGSTLTIQSLGHAEVTLDPFAESTELRMEPVWPDAFLQGSAGQQADPDFPPPDLTPTYPSGEGPIVYMDEGHHNFHTATGRYRAFAEALTADGYRVRGWGGAFVDGGPEPDGILIIATPLNGTENRTLPARSAFKPAEIENAVEWVTAGGSLLLIGDHMPIAGAFEELFRAFGLETENGYVMDLDDEGDLLRGAPMIFGRANGLLGDHPISEGSGPGERIDSIATFTGLAFTAPDTYRPLLTLSERAVSVNTQVWGIFEDDTPIVPVGGWLQGATARIGEGRLAVIGEAAMFTAQVRGDDRRRNGLSSPEAGDNRQFALNLIHWLDGRLD